jgi:hypothetical protein
VGLLMGWLIILLSVRFTSFLPGRAAETGISRPVPAGPGAVVGQRAWSWATVMTTLPVLCPASTYR